MNANEREEFMQRLADLIDDRIGAGVPFRLVVNLPAGGPVPSVFFQRRLADLNYRPYAPDQEGVGA